MVTRTLAFSCVCLLIVALSACDYSPITAEDIVVTGQKADMTDCEREAPQACDIAQRLTYAIPSSATCAAVTPPIFWEEDEGLEWDRSLNADEEDEEKEDCFYRYGDFCICAFEAPKPVHNPDPVALATWECALVEPASYQFEGGDAAMEMLAANSLDLAQHTPTTGGYQPIVHDRASVIVLDTVQSSTDGLGLGEGDAMHGRVITGLLHRAACGEVPCKGDAIRVKRVFNYSVDGGVALEAPDGGDRAYPSDIARAIVESVTSHASQNSSKPLVFNLSLGWDEASDASITGCEIDAPAFGNCLMPPKTNKPITRPWLVASAVDHAINTLENVAFVAAAGNRSHRRHAGDVLSWPARISRAEVISVGALSANGQPVWSSRGGVAFEEQPDRWALGVGAFTDQVQVLTSLTTKCPYSDTTTLFEYVEGGTCPYPTPILSGTSVAAAHFAGELAARWSQPNEENELEFWGLGTILGPKPILAGFSMPGSPAGVDTAAQCVPVPSITSPPGTVMAEPFPSPFPCGHCSLLETTDMEAKVQFQHNPMYPNSDVKYLAVLLDFGGGILERFVMFDRDAGIGQLFVGATQIRFGQTGEPLRAAFEMTYDLRGSGRHQSATFAVPIR